MSARAQSNYQDSQDAPFDDLSVVASDAVHGTAMHPIATLRTQTALLCLPLRRCRIHQNQQDRSCIRSLWDGASSIMQLSLALLTLGGATLSAAQQPLWQFQDVASSVCANATLRDLSNF